MAECNFIMCDDGYHFRMDGISCEAAGVATTIAMELNMSDRPTVRMREQERIVDNNAMTMGIRTTHTHTHIANERSENVNAKRNSARLKCAEMSVTA